MSIKKTTPDPNRDFIFAALGLLVDHAAEGDEVATELLQRLQSNRRSSMSTHSLILSAYQSRCERNCRKSSTNSMKSSDLHVGHVSMNSKATDVARVRNFPRVSLAQSRPSKRYGFPETVLKKLKSIWITTATWNRF